MLVTAAGQGIGKASALAMAEQGADVWATDVNPALLASYAGLPYIRTAVLDVLDKSEIVRVVASLPTLDVLFNCAGFVHAGTRVVVIETLGDLLEVVVFGTHPQLPH